MTDKTANDYKKKAALLVAKMTVEEQAKQLLFNAPSIERLNIPAYNWWNEALHGVARAGTATIFPQAIGLAAMFSPEFLEEIGDIISTEGRAKYNAVNSLGDRDIYKGLTFWSPNVNIFRDPRWGRGQETYGEDPYLTSRLGVAFINGLQGYGEVLKSAACVKHFAVHSGPESLRHKFDSRVSMKDLFETYLPAFEACVAEAGVEAVMGAYNRTLGEPCCGSFFLLQKILREKWGFQGHVVSDCWAIRDFHENHKVTYSAVESAALALNAGCDLNCGCVYSQLMDSYKKGLVTNERIKQAAERLFTTRYKLGLIEGCDFDKIPLVENDSLEHNAAAIKAAEKSIVLLKNNGILPLQKEKLCKISIIGPNADNRLALVGNYHGTASRYITILEGMRLLTDNEIPILYSEGCHITQDRIEYLACSGDRLAEAESMALNSDVVILCLGLDETLEGEEEDAGKSYISGDRENLLLPKSQRLLLERMVSTKKPIILCLLTGSAIELQYADEYCSAILQCWYPGAQGGIAIAKILFGEISPSGKLPITFYRSVEDLPPFEDYNMEGRTYRYYRGSPLYPFGYGLTYADVYCEKVEILGKPVSESGLLLRATVHNSGCRPTEDVLQVYIQPCDSSFAPPNPSLCAFKRLTINEGETTRLDISISERSFTVVNDLGDRIRAGSKYRLYVGFGQSDERTKVLTGHESIIIDVNIDEPF